MSSSRITPHHHILKVIETDAARLRQLGVSQSRLHSGPRPKAEVFFNIVGYLFGCVMRRVPWPWRRRLDLWIVQKLGKKAVPLPPELFNRAHEAVQMARQIQQETGQWPAMMVFTSHAPTTGPLEWLRFELLRYGLVIADAVVEAQKPGRWFASAPECLLAIDPFALDTLGPAVAGFYAGWMHGIYLAYDRQSLTQNRLQRRLVLRGTGHATIVHRLLRKLRQDIPILMVLSGGLPHNARLLYTVREFIHRLPIPKWPYSVREAEHRLMNIVRTPAEDALPTDTGALPNAVRIQVHQLLKEWGVEDTEVALKDLEVEFRLEVPYRERLFRMLIGRLAKKGKPLVWLGISHHEQPPYVRLSDIWACYRDRQGRLQIIQSPKFHPVHAPDIATMARDFVLTSFPPGPTGS